MGNPLSFFLLYTDTDYFAEENSLEKKKNHHRATESSEKE
jgi:hypothetical protein